MQGIMKRPLVPEGKVADTMPSRKHESHSCDLRMHHKFGLFKVDLIMCAARISSSASLVPNWLRMTNSDGGHHLIFILQPAVVELMVFT